MDVMNQEDDRLRREQRSEKGNPIPNIKNSIKLSIVPQEEPPGPKVDGESSPSSSNEDPVHHLIALRSTRSSWVSTEYGHLMSIANPTTGLLK